MEEEREERYRSQTYGQLKSNKMRFEPKHDAIALTHKPKFMYPQFNLYELEVNRLASLPEYKALAGEITAFNQELDDWKKRNIEIRNLFVTYHLYQNLYSRMKYTSSLIIERGEAKRAFAEIIKWFLEQKPRIRNKVPEKEEGKMKPSTADRETACEIDSLLTSSKTKRQLKVYEAMSRTAHSDLFPPKERLLDYKRKEIVQGISQQPRLQKRALSHNTLGKIQKYSGSFASTMTSFKHAVVTELKREESKIEPVVVPFEVKESVVAVEPKQEELREVREEELQDMQREKNVVQEQLLQQNLVQVVHQEDVPDGEEELIEEEEEKTDDKYKKYKEDPNAEEQMIAEENIKDIRQSTLRRILKQKQEAIRTKMEELSVASQMLNWGAVKGRMTAEAHTKSERRSLINRYTQMQFVPKTFEQRQSARKRDIPEYPLLYRSKSSYGESIEREVERHKINSALKTYGKYINHIEIRPVSVQTEQEREELKVMRATSLTSFAKQGKRTPFSQMVEAHGAGRHNDDAEDYVLFAKERLAKKGVAVEKQSLMGALSVTNAARIEKQPAFPPQTRLFSNPFFPKHLYQTKPKKKKK